MIKIVTGLLLTSFLFVSTAFAQDGKGFDVRSFVASLDQSMSEKQQRKALWDEITKELAKSFPDYKAYILPARGGSQRIMAHGLFAAENKYTDLNFVAFHLPNLDGSVAVSPARFRVWRTNALGRNKRKVWYEDRGSRKVQSQGFRRVKIGSNTENMVVFVKRVEVDLAKGANDSDVGTCLPKPINYDDWLARCS